MKTIAPVVQMSLTQNSVRYGINTLAEQFDGGLSAVYFVVCFPWNLVFSWKMREDDDAERGGPPVFYLNRRHGWESKEHWEVIMFDAASHEPLAKFESKPTY